MAGVWADDGIKAALDDIVAGAGFATAKLRLFKNNVTPSNATVLGDLTEATFAGYAAISLAGWSAAAVTAHVAQTDPTAGTFTITAGTQAIYGWYVTDSGNTKLYWAQRDPAAPVTLDSSALNQYVVTASLQAKDTAT